METNYRCYCCENGFTVVATAAATATLLVLLLYLMMFNDSSAFSELITHNTIFSCILSQPPNCTPDNINILPNLLDKQTTIMGFNMFSVFLVNRFM